MGVKTDMNMVARKLTVVCALALIGLLGAAAIPPQARAQLGLPLLGSLVVTITSPASGSTVSGTRTVSAGVTIIGSLLVSGVQFKLDGTNLGAEDTSSQYSISWNTTAVSNGWHTLTAVARDALGIRWTSDPVAVRVLNDTMPPMVTISFPASGAAVADTITVTAAVSDNVGVIGVQFKVDGANLGPEDTTAPEEAIWDTTQFSNGPHTLTAVARDSAGNRATSAGVMVTVANAPPPPADTTSPTVAITSPSSGESVSETVAVMADAFDDVGVVGVEFFDGSTLIGDDTTAPHTVSWDTTAVSNGSHSLTAVARDAAGNRTTSEAVTVTVSNAAPPPVTVTRFEEERTDVITYTSGWVLDTSRTWSGGAAGTAMTAGATAVFTFTGPSVNWIGFRGPVAGIASVSLDGAPAIEIDLFSPTEEIRAVVFSARDLANTVHTLAIEVTGTGNAAATGVAVVIDAFDVPGPTVARIQQTDPSVTYAGIWQLENADRPTTYSGGTAAESIAGGATATFTFTGPSVTWIGARGPVAGIARVSLDGVFVVEVDTYSPLEELQAAIFSRDGLSNTTHTLTVEVTGLKNPAATNFFIIVDAFEVTF